MLIFRFWESGNDIVVRVGETKSSGSISVAGSFVVSKESWKEFQESQCKCEGKTNHFQKLSKHPGL